MHSHPSVVRVTARLAELGAGGQVRTLDDAARTAAQAAAQLGIEVAQIANSLVFAADGAPLLVMASGGHRVDTAKVGRAGRRPSVDRASPRVRPGDAGGHHQQGVADVGGEDQGVGDLGDLDTELLGGLGRGARDSSRVQDLPAGAELGQPVGDPDDTGMAVHRTEVSPARGRA